MSAMIRRLAGVLAITGFIATAAWAGKETIPAGGDLSRLQGRWTAKAGHRSDIDVVLEIQGRRVDAAITTSTGLRLLAQGEVRIDETTSPRSVDWVKFNGPDQDEFPELPGIYKLDRDQFVVCNGGFRGRRPTEFKSGEGVLAQVVTFQRASTKTGDKTKSTTRTTSSTRDLQADNAATDR